MGTEGARVLLADLDEAAIVRVAEALRPRGFDVVCATTVTSACDAAREGIDAVVATRRMIEDESSGLGLVDAMALETTSNPPFVIWGDEWSEDAPGELEAKLRALLPHVTRSGVAAMVMVWDADSAMEMFYPILRLEGFAVGLTRGP